MCCKICQFCCRGRRARGGEGRVDPEREGHDGGHAAEDAAEARELRGLPDAGLPAVPLHRARSRLYRNDTPFSTRERLWRGRSKKGKTQLYQRLPTVISSLDLLIYSKDL